LDSPQGTRLAIAGAAVLFSLLPAAALAAPTVQTSPQGNWIGNFGSPGWALGGWDGGRADVVQWPGSVSLLQGNRTLWGEDPGSDMRALQSPVRPIRRAATWYDESDIRLRLTFNGAYDGNLHLYVLNWFSSGNRWATLTIDTKAVVDEQPTSLGTILPRPPPFAQGHWVTFPVDVQQGGSVTIGVHRLAGFNAVLSGVFLGD
jgi:hypothetical protein